MQTSYIIDTDGDVWVSGGNDIMRLTEPKKSKCKSKSCLNDNGEIYCFDKISNPSKKKFDKIVYNRGGTVLLLDEDGILWIGGYDPRNGRSSYRIKKFGNPREGDRRSFFVRWAAKVAWANNIIPIIDIDIDESIMAAVSADGELWVLQFDYEGGDFDTINGVKLNSDYLTRVTKNPDFDKSETATFFNKVFLPKYNYNKKLFIDMIDQNGKIYTLDENNNLEMDDTFKETDKFVKIVSTDKSQMFITDKGDIRLFSSEDDYIFKNVKDLTFDGQIIDIAAGPTYFMFIDNKGNIYGMGWHVPAYGELVYFTLIKRDADAMRIMCFDNSYMYIDSNGTNWVAGDNTAGQLGVSPKNKTNKLNIFVESGPTDVDFKGISFRHMFDNAKDLDNFFREAPEEEELPF